MNRRRTVALVTTTDDVLNGEDVDTLTAIHALQAIGIEAVAPLWHDESVDWSNFELVVLRSPWDYPERLDAFMPWLRRTAESTVVCNPASMIEWNLDKRYLRDLAAARVAVVPTMFCATTDEVDAAIANQGHEFVVKPSVSIGARDTGRFVPGDERAVELAHKILRDQKLVMVQPFVPKVADRGETALVYFGGVFSHAFRKGPFLDVGGVLLGGSYSEVVDAAMPSATQIELADHAVAAIRGRFGSAPVYGRFDIVEGSDGLPMLLEAELFEPSFFFATAPGSEHRYAKAIADQL